MQEPFTRDRIIEALQAMPPEATIDDAIERLVFLAKIEAGLAELDRSEGVPHDAARRHFGL
jgi:predicted transcriptional regulator